MIDNRILTMLQGLTPPGESANPSTEDYRRLVEKTIDLYVPSDVATTSVVAESSRFRVERPSIIVAAYINAGATITANDINYVNFIGSKRTSGTPGIPVAFLTAPTKITAGTGNVTAFLWTDVSAYFDADLTKRTLAAGDAVTMQCTKGGSITLPGGTTFVLLLKEMSDA